MYNVSFFNFVAWAAGLNLLNPFNDKTANFDNGVNFAVAGSTATAVEKLAVQHIHGNITTSSSLDIQVNWMDEYLAKFCKDDAGLLWPCFCDILSCLYGLNTSILHQTASCLTENSILLLHFTDCSDKLKNSLFIVGETGGNDYNYALMARKTIDEIKATVVPEVVETIINGTTVSLVHNSPTIHYITPTFILFPDLIFFFFLNFVLCVTSETNKAWCTEVDGTWKFSSRLSPNLPYPFPNEKLNI